MYISESTVPREIDVIMCRLTEAPAAPALSCDRIAHDPIAQDFSIRTTAAKLSAT